MKKSFWIVWLLICVSLSAVVVGCGEGDPAATTAPSVTTTAPTVITTAPTVAPTAPTVAPSAPTVAPSAPTVAPTAPTVAPTAPTVAPTAPTVAPTAPTVAPTAPTAAPTAPTTKPTEPAPTTKPTEPVPTTRPTEPAPTTRPTEPTPTTRPTEPALTTKPTEPVPTTRPTEPAPTTRPTEPTPTTRPTEPAPTTRPTEPAPTTRPTEPTPTTQPTEPEETTQPTEPKDPSIVISYYDENGGSLEPLPNPIRIQTMKYDDQRRPVYQEMVLVKTGKPLYRYDWYYSADGGKEEIYTEYAENGEMDSKTIRKWDKDERDIYYCYCDSTGNAKETVETTYYANGNRKTEERWTPDSSDILWSKTEYYSNSNMAREEYRRVHNVTGWATYWENGKPKETEVTKNNLLERHAKYNEQGIEIYSKIVSENGQEITEQWNDDQGKTLKVSVDINGIRTVIEYENGKEVKNTVYLEDGRIYSEATTTYHSNGNEYEKNYWDLDGSSSAYVFRTDGTLEKIESASADGSASEYHYWADGNTMKYELAVNAYGDKSEKYFTEAGKLRSSTETWNDGTRIETAYNANEQPVERLNYNKSGVLMSKTTCRYNSSGNWLSEEETEYYEDGIRTLDEYDRYGRIIQSFRYDGTGLIQEQFNQYFGTDSLLVWKTYIYNKDRSYTLITYYENGVASSVKEYTPQDKCVLEVFYDEEGNETGRTGSGG